MLSLLAAAPALAGEDVASFYRGTKGYDTKAIGVADDTIDADAVTVFDFWQAQDQARAWAEQQRLVAAGVICAGPYKVANAVKDYLVEIAAESGELTDEVGDVGLVGLLDRLLAHHGDGSRRFISVADDA